MRSIYLIVATIICIGNLCSQINLDSGLVAYYPFNGNAIDESGNDNHGTVMGALLTSDRFGSDSVAYEFNGTSSYITVPNSPTLHSPTTELSQVAWINIYSWSLVGTQFGPILMKSNSGANAFQYRLSVGSSGVNTAISNWTNGVTVSDTLNFNDWYMIVSTLKDDTVKAYVNGIFIGEGILTGPINPDSRPLEIGRDVPGVTEIFHGKIDDIRIYNRTLTPAEIDSLYDDFTTSIDVQSNAIPKNFEIYQNYPNPFNPATTIGFSIPQTEFVTLKIYNILGEEVATLVNKRQAAGSYNVLFDASQLSSGIYFYKIIAGRYTKVMKMMQMK